MDAAQPAPTMITTGKTTIMNPAEQYRQRQISQMYQKQATQRGFTDHNREWSYHARHPSYREPIYPTLSRPIPQGELRPRFFVCYLKKLPQSIISLLLSSRMPILFVLWMMVLQAGLYSDRFLHKNLQTDAGRYNWKGDKYADPDRVIPDRWTKKQFVTTSHDFEDGYGLAGKRVPSNREGDVYPDIAAPKHDKASSKVMPREASEPPPLFSFSLAGHSVVIP